MDLTRRHNPTLFYPEKLLARGMPFVKATLLRENVGGARLDTIYRAMITNRLFDSSEPHPPGGQATLLLPWHEIGLLARAGSAERHLRWSTEDCPRSTDPWKRLYSIVNLIRRIAQSHSEYQALIAKRLAST